MKPEMTPEDIGLVARIREGYQPPPMTDLERRRFDARLRARIASQQRRRAWGFGGLALTAAAAAALFFAARQTEPPAPNPGPQPAMAAAPTESPQADGESGGEAIALDWLVDEDRADWLGGSTVLPADPLELAALDGVASPVAADPSDADAADGDTDDGSPEWMPAEYDLLASLIEIEPYDPYAEDWP